MTQDMPVQLVPYLIEDRASRSPESIALIYEGKELTYKELNSQANGLARRLRAYGAGPETIIGLCLERSIEMIVGLLGILKAGAAYLPLDPSYPEERLRFMIDDAKPLCLLTASSSKIARPEGTKWIQLDSTQTRDQLTRQSYDNLERAEIALHAEHPAYVIYTSGSTGRPKGVVISHGSLENRLAWMQGSYRLQADESVLQKTPFSFDVSVWEFFWPLSQGARLVVAAPGGHKHPRYLVDLISKHQVTTLHFVPSMLSAFLALTAGTNEFALSSLRRVVVSGEALGAKLARSARLRLRSAALYNLYGPTEATVDVTAWTCPEPDEEWHTVPIGQPIWNTEAYVLDARLARLATGITGELYLAGRCLARGYLRRSSLTAERFVACPWGLPGERMYRTGDLVRWLADGNLEYLGRVDDQVKIRGFRIELGEIEARLNELDGVGQCTVLAHEGTSENELEDRQLIGYVVPTDAAAPPTMEALRSSLARVLPEHMVPAQLMLLPNLPVTANGKLDRRRLPASASYQQHTSTAT